MMLMSMEERDEHCHKMSQRWGVRKRVVFKKGGFGGCSLVPRTGTRVHSDVPQNENRNEGIGQDFYQTYARITGNQGLAQIFLGPFLALNIGK